MTQSKVQSELLAPFPESDLEWRVQSAGDKNGKTWCKVLVYVTNRAIMDRLDSVFGIEGWQNEFRPLDGGGNLCGISIKLGDEWITKWDGAENTNMEAVKGGISGAMKRAGVQWGIGRYLYNVTVMWGNVSDKGKLKGQWIDKSKVKHYFNYDPPKLPAWALPTGSGDTENPPVNIFKNKVGKAFKGFIELEAEKEFFNVLGVLGYDNSDKVPVNKQREVLLAFSDKLKELKEGEK